MPNLVMIGPTVWISIPDTHTHTHTHTNPDSTLYIRFLGQHRILPYLFVKTLFDGHPIGSGFTKFSLENDKLFV